MGDNKKRVAVMLPITPDEFQPMAEWFEGEGIVLGRVALNHFRKIFAAKDLHAGERIQPNARTERRGKGKQS